MSISKTQSERRDLNPRPPPWQGDALPLSYFRKTSYSKQTTKIASANLIHFLNNQNIF